MATTRQSAFALAIAAAILPAAFTFGAVVQAAHPTAAPPARRAPQVAPWRASAAFHALPGDVLIADEQNSRIILVTPQKKIVWQYPVPGHAPNKAFRFPDDAFFTPGYGGVITNEEDNGTVGIVSFRHPKVVWQYGTPGIEGSGPGQLDFPDDAVLYPNGIVTVADIRNQRIVFLSVRTHRIVKTYGKLGIYRSDPPYTYGAPNGDFPGPNGGMLVSEINNLNDQVILLSRDNHVVYQFHIPHIQYISDANFTPNGNIIAVDYSDPGQIVIVNRSGHVLWRWDYTSGNRRLSEPSLAIQLPNGMILCNDDHNDRVILIDPKTRKIVWQYGKTGVPGIGPGMLNTPDGLDFLPAGITPGKVPALPSGGR